MTNVLKTSIDGKVGPSVTSTRLDKYSCTRALIAVGNRQKTSKFFTGGYCTVINSCFAEMIAMNFVLYVNLVFVTTYNAPEDYEALKKQLRHTWYKL